MFIVFQSLTFYAQEGLKAHQDSGELICVWMTVTGIVLERKLTPDIKTIAFKRMLVSRKTGLHWIDWLNWWMDPWSSDIVIQTPRNTLILCEWLVMPLNHNRSLMCKRDASSSCRDVCCSTNKKIHSPAALSGTLC